MFNILKAQARNTRFLEHVSERVIEETVNRIRLLLNDKQNM